MRMWLFLVGIEFLACSAFAETCTSPDEPSCTITCDEGCLAATGDGGCITQCSDTAVTPQFKPVTGRVSADIKKLPVDVLLKRLATPRAFRLGQHSERVAPVLGWVCHARDRARRRPFWPRSEISLRQGAELRASGQDGIAQIMPALSPPMALIFDKAHTRTLFGEMICTADW
jgi:hypothetical protein